MAWIIVQPKPDSGRVWHHRDMEPTLSPSTALAVGLAVLAAACSGPGGSSSSPTSTKETTGATQGASATLPAELGIAELDELSCFATDAEPPDDFEQVLGAVALPTSRTYPNALQTAERVAEDGSIYYFAKTGLVWRGDEAIELRVPMELRPVLAIGWGGPAQPASAVTVDCTVSEDWQVLPGGYWVTEPMCAEVVVRVGGNEQLVEIGLGKACSGQEPPPN